MHTAQQDGQPRPALGRAWLGVAAGVAGAVVTAHQLSRRRRRESAADRSIRVSKTFTINREPEAVYAAWRQLDDLPDVLRYLRSLHSDLLEDVPNTRLAWQSPPHSSEDRSAGSVHFRRAPGGRGTELQVEIRYTPIAGRPGAAVARLLRGAPEQRIQEDLRRLKQLLETGEIASAGGAR